MTMFDLGEFRCACRSVAIASRKNLFVIFTDRRIFFRAKFIFLRMRFKKRNLSDSFHLLSMYRSEKMFREFPVSLHIASICVCEYDIANNGNLRQVGKFVA